jgi:hypothetical protein
MQRRKEGRKEERKPLYNVLIMMFCQRMFGKKESTFRRDYFWGNMSTKISDIRIELKDQNKTIISLADKSDDKNPKYPSATTLLITRNPQNGDLLLDYLKDDKPLAQEIISGHIVSRISVEFP